MLHEALKISKETGQDFRLHGDPGFYNSTLISKMSDNEIYFTKREVLATDWEMVEEKIEVTRIQVIDALPELARLLKDSAGGSSFMDVTPFLKKLGFK